MVWNPHPNWLILKPPTSKSWKKNQILSKHLDKTTAPTTLIDPFATSQHRHRGATGRSSPRFWPGSHDGGIEDQGASERSLVRRVMGTTIQLGYRQIDGWKLWPVEHGGTWWNMMEHGNRWNWFSLQNGAHKKRDASQRKPQHFLRSNMTWASATCVYILEWISWRSWVWSA